MKITTFAQCMDIFDWFDDPLYEYLNHILLSKLDAHDRIGRAMPALTAAARELVAAHADREGAFPDESDKEPA